MGQEVGSQDEWRGLGCLRSAALNYMFNDAEKEELKRIVNKFVEQRRCFRPIEPDKVMQEVNRFKQTEGSMEEVESTEVLPRFQL